MRFYSYLILLLPGFLSSCSPEEAEKNDPVEVIYNYSPIELELLELVNTYRQTSGLRKLENLKEVSIQARLHNDHMNLLGHVCHHNIGIRLRTLAEETGAKSIGENVGSGFDSAEAIFNAWLKSPGHRKVIEGGSTHFGTAVSETRRDKAYVTLILISK